MPRYSKLIHFLRRLDASLPKALLLEDDPSPQSTFSLLQLVYEATMRSRYLHRPRAYSIGREKNWQDLIERHHRKTDEDFRRMFRVDKHEFTRILSRI